MAKVITTVLKFPADQAQKILDREDARTLVSPEKKTKLFFSCAHFYVREKLFGYWPFPTEQFWYYKISPRRKDFGQNWKAVSAADS